MVFSALAAVAFIDQHDDLVRRVLALWQLGRRVELLEQGEDDPFGPSANAFGQVTA